MGPRNILDELGVGSELFAVDFSDAETVRILADRWLYTANLLGIVYQHTVIPFGEGKYHYKASLAGSQEDMEQFLQFVDSSLGLLQEM